MRELLLTRLRTLPGLDEGRSQWVDEPAFWLDGREIAHFHGDEIEIRLTRRRLRRRLEDERVWQRSPHSDWLVVGVRELELVVELTREAIDANRRRPG
jgi:hypothetical protein